MYDLTVKFDAELFPDSRINLKQAITHGLESELGVLLKHVYSNGRNEVYALPDGGNIRLDVWDKHIKARLHLPKDICEYKSARTSGTTYKFSDTMISMLVALAVRRQFRKKFPALWVEDDEAPEEEFEDEEVDSLFSRAA